MAEAFTLIETNKYIRKVGLKFFQQKSVTNLFYSFVAEFFVTFSTSCMMQYQRIKYNALEIYI